MASNEQLLLIAKARRRRAEAEAAAAAPPAPAPTAPPPEPSLIDHIMQGVQAAGGLASQGLYGFNTGFENTIGLPGDLVHAVPGGEYVPIFGSLPTSKMLGQIFQRDKRPAPNGPLETIANRTGQEYGAAAVPVLGEAKLALDAGVDAVRAMPGIARYFLEPAAVDPAKFIGKEAAATSAAGVGAGVANTLVDPHTTQGQYADLGGALAGVGVTSLGGTVLKSLGTLFNAVRQNPNYIDQTVRDAVVDRMARAADLPGVDNAGTAYDVDPLVEQIMNGTPGRERPSQVIPGFQESTADRTGNPGLAAFEYSRQSGPNAGKFAKRRSANTEAVNSAMNSIAPEATPGEFRSALDAARQARLDAAAQGTQAAQTDFERYMQNLMPQMGAEDRGSTVREGLTNAERAARESERAIWEGINGQVDPAPLADALDEARAGLTTARQQRIGDLSQTADIPRGFAPRAVDPETGLPVEGPTPPAEPIPLAEVNDMRSTLAQEQRNARNGPQPDTNRAEAIGRLLAATEDYLGSDAVPADTRAALDTARGVSRNVNERFNRPNDPIAAVLATREGRPNVPDSAVASRFVQPDTGQSSNIDRILAETDLSSHAKPVRAALRDEILAQVEKSRAAGDPEKLSQFLDRFSNVFDRFPDLRQEVTQAAGAGRRLNEAGSAETALQRDLGTPNGEVKGTGPVAKYLAYGDEQSERAISGVLASKDPAKAADELMNTVGNSPKAVEGARAAFWQKLRSESQSTDNSQRSMGGTRAWRGDWMKNFLDTPAVAAVADRLYRDDPEKLAALYKFANVLDNVDLRQRGKAVGTSGTAQGVNPILSPETLQSRFYAWMQGRVGGTYLVTSMAAVLARRAVRSAQTNAIERLTDKVLLDPELAAELLKDNNPANRAALARKAKGWTANELSTALRLLNGDDKQDETTKAVMR